MASMARFGARAEDLARIVGADLVLIAISGDYTDASQPFLMPGIIAGYGAERLYPRGLHPSGVDREHIHALPDFVGGGIQVVDDLLVRITAVHRRCRRCADPWRQGRCLLVCVGSLRDSEHRAGNIVTRHAEWARMGRSASGGVGMTGGACGVVVAGDRVGTTEWERPARLKFAA